MTKTDAQDSLLAWIGCLYNLLREWDQKGPKSLIVLELLPNTQRQQCFECNFFLFFQDKEKKKKLEKKKKTKEQEKKEARKAEKAAKAEASNSNTVNGDVLDSEALTNGGDADKAIAGKNLFTHSAKAKVMNSLFYFVVFTHRHRFCILFH